jgi:hypothetical protein
LKKIERKKKRELLGGETLWNFSLQERTDLLRTPVLGKNPSTCRDWAEKNIFAAEISLPGTENETYAVRSPVF